MSGICNSNIYTICNIFNIFSKLFPALVQNYLYANECELVTWIEQEIYTLCRFWKPFSRARRWQSTMAVCIRTCYFPVRHGLIYHRYLHVLERFHQRSLRLILGIQCRHRKDQCNHHRIHHQRFILKTAE